MDNELILSIKSVINKADKLVSDLANVSALLYKYIPNVSWAGFYIAENDSLYLGPFQGEIACTNIPFGKGVCGEAAKEQASKVIPNVLVYPNHIACSDKSRSEIVVPIIKNGKVFGVIDLDSEQFDNFKQNELETLEKIAEIISDLFE